MHHIRYGSPFRSTLNLSRDTTKNIISTYRYVNLESAYTSNSQPVLATDETLAFSFIV